MSDKYLLIGSTTTIISNPIWVVQTSQAVRSPEPTVSAPTSRKLGVLETIHSILSKNGVAGFWRGIGPALVLVINPVIQYTVFEQLKNILIKGRTAKLRARGLSKTVAVLSDLDYFFLGALSKLSEFVFVLYQQYRINENTIGSCNLCNIPLHVRGYIETFRTVVTVRLQSGKESAPSGPVPVQIFSAWPCNNFERGRHTRALQGYWEQARSECAYRCHPVCGAEENIRTYKEGGWYWITVSPD